MKVGDVAVLEGGWNCNLLSGILPPTIIAMISGLLTPNLFEELDSIVWLPNKDGNFSVQSAYYEIAQHSCLGKNPLFDMIWSWEGLERIRIFLWLVSNEFLHTNAFRSYRHMAQLDFCSRCNEDLSKTILHALRDCSILGDF